MRRLFLMLLAVAGTWAMAACQPSHVTEAGAHTPLAPRTVLLYVDVSASRRSTDDSAAMRSIVADLRARDRLVVIPAGRPLGDLRPVIDTLLPGTLIDSWVQSAGLEAGRNAALTTKRRALIEARVRRAIQGAVTREGRPAESRLLDAVWHAGDVARSTAADHGGVRSAPRIEALLLSDGREESAIVNVAHAVPGPAVTRALVKRLQEQGCDLNTPGLRVRVLGVRHARDTQALTRWWITMLTDLGAHVRAGDVVTVPLTNLL
jgi:hypothetical protein